MHSFLLACVLSLISTTALVAGEAPWLTDFQTATALAVREHKVVLIDFTGSDWCGWCMRLDAEVFSTAEFAAWAEKHAVLLEVDFPHRKAMSDRQREHNEALAERYAVEGFPTVVVLGADGRVLGRLGYQEGGAKAWIAEAERIIARKV